MARDSQNKLSKKEQNKRSNKQEELSKKKKKIENPDSDNDGIDSENDEMDVHEYRKFISKIFPSKHLTNKIKAGDKLKKLVDQVESDEDDDEEEEVKPKKKSSSKKNKKVEESEEEWETDSDEDEEILIKKNKKNKNNKKNKKNKKIEVSDDEISLGEEDTEDEEDEEIAFDKKGNGKLNIIFTIGGMGEDEDEDDWNEEDYDPDYDEEDDSEMETENEDEEVSTDSSEDEDEDEDEEEEEEEKPKKVSRKSKSSEEEEEEEKPKKVLKKSKSSEQENKPSEDKSDVLEKLKNLLESNPNDKSIQKCIDVYEEEIKTTKKKLQKKEKKQKDKNLRIFRKIIKDKNTMNDFSFYEKLEIENQKKIIKELREINKITRIEKPYRMTLLESDIPVQFKSAAMKKINSLRYMEPGSGEFYKIKNWVDTFMRIPFSKHEGLPISIEDGVDKCHEFMENAQNTLDQAVYGLNDAKMQIMQMLGQLLTNPKAIGTAIAIHGPPGTGKTSLVKEGISKILNRPFAFIALGGATDSSFLEGHGYTYEGSTWGKIVQILIDSKCMNPVIYFDELDKISDTPRGEEIAGILTHLTDTSQNSQFHDKYFAEINFDLSKCLFIFSYNDESKVNPILKDRMYRIKTKGYSGKEKSVIANNYLLPKIHEQVRFNKDEIIIPDDVVSHIVDNHCNKEDGVRNLKRCLEIIYTKLNLYRLMKPGSNLFEGEMSLKVEFPYKVTKEIVDKLIKKESDGLETWRSLYS
jgi:ATP-dependent Lon protease